MTVILKFIKAFSAPNKILTSSNRFSNIEDIARDGGSIDLDEESLLCKFYTKNFIKLITGCIISYCFCVSEDLQTELGELNLTDDMTYGPLFEMTQVVIVIRYWQGLHLFPKHLSQCI